MTADNSPRRRCHMVAFISFTLISAFHSQAFQTTPVLQPIRSTTFLASSLTTPPGSKEAAGDTDDGRGNDRNTRKADHGIQVIPIEDNRDINDFYSHLRKIVKRVNNNRKAATIVDAAVQEMERRYYGDNTGKDESAGLSRKTDYSYRGSTVQPDARCYSMVINAIASARLGAKGAKMAGEVLQRYQKYTGDDANIFVLKATMKACLIAGDIERAEYHLKQIERIVEGTSVRSQLVHAYALFLEKLWTSPGKRSKNIGSLAMDILQRARDIYLHDEMEDFPPYLSEMYIAAMRCQEVAYKEIQAFSSVNEVFTLLEEDFASCGRPDGLKPNASAVLRVITAASRCKGSIKAIEASEKVLANLLSRYDETNDDDYLPMEQIYTLMLSTYGKVSARNARRCSEKAGELLRTMDRYDMTPNKFILTSAIMAIANDRRKESLVEAEKLFGRIQDPDEFAYQCLIKANCRQGNVERAEEYLAELDANWGADVMTMGLCVDSWSKSKTNQETAVERSQILLDKIVRRYQMGLVGPYERHVNTWVFESVARVLSQSRTPEAGDKIVTLIEKMAALHQDIPGLFAPTDNIYTLAVDAYSTGGSLNAGRSTLDLLSKMDALAQSGVLPEPNNRILSSAMGSFRGQQGRQFLDEASRIFQRILINFEDGDRTVNLTPRTLTASFSVLLRKSDEAAVAEILDLLERVVELAKLHPKEVKLNTIVFNAVLSGLNRKKDTFAASDTAWRLFGEMKELAKEGFKTNPDAFTYTSIARAVSRSRDPSEVERLDDLVDEILVLRKAGILEADIRLFDALLAAYSNVATSDSTAYCAATDLLSKLEELSGQGDTSLSPNIMSYKNTCLALARSKVRDSSQIVTHMYERAKELASNDAADSLDRDFYFSVISTLTRDTENGGIGKAERILEEMEANYENCTDVAVPDTALYNYIVSAIASSLDEDKISRTTAIFDRMLKLNEEKDPSRIPDVHTYNWVILAASRSHSTSAELVRRNFDVALEKFKSIHSTEVDAEPDSLTYALFMRSCINLLPQGEVQKSLIKKAFILCRQKGLATPHIVSMVCCYYPELEESLEVIRTSTFSKEAKSQEMRVIPVDWCKNVPEKERKRKVEIGRCHTEYDVLGF